MTGTSSKCAGRADLIQTIARAIDPDWFGVIDGRHPLDNYPKQHELHQSKAMARALDALTALQDAGYAIVPREPTEAMLAAAGQGPWPFPDLAPIYRAMIAAITTGERNG